MQTLILCGGKGTRLREETEFRPKPMVEIGGRPILWHIMKYYASFGFKDFVLALGYKGEQIRDYFLHYAWRTHTVSVELKSGSVQVHDPGHLEDWKVTLVDTGQETMTGSRVRACAPFLRDEDFFLTYGDGLSTVPLDALLQFHRAHGRIGTLSGMLEPSRYGELTLNGTQVLQFSEKPLEASRYISGGFFVFQKRLLEWLEPGPGCTLERTPLEKLAQADQLQVFRHEGFFASMDTWRDWQALNQRWTRGDRPWARWEVPTEPGIVP